MSGYCLTSDCEQNRAGECMTDCPCWKRLAHKPDPNESPSSPRTSGSPAGIDNNHIKQLIKFCIERGTVCSKSCNSHHINSVINQMRGAIWLVTGKDPGSSFNDLKDIAEILGVEYSIVGNEIKFTEYPDL